MACTFPFETETVLTKTDPSYFIPSVLIQLMFFEEMVSPLLFFKSENEILTLLKSCKA